MGRDTGLGIVAPADDSDDVVQLLGGQRVVEDPSVIRAVREGPVRRRSTPTHNHNPRPPKTRAEKHTLKHRWPDSGPPPPAEVVCSYLVPSYVAFCSFSLETLLETL